MLKKKGFLFGVLVLAWLFWSDYNGSSGIRTVDATEPPIPESVRNNPGAYRAQLAAAAVARSVGRK